MQLGTRAEETADERGREKERGGKRPFFRARRSELREWLDLRYFSFVSASGFCDR